MGRRANIFASLRSINHIMRDFLCRHTVRMIITTIINIIMCPTFLLTLSLPYFCCYSTFPSSLQLFTKSEHVRIVLLCANMCACVSHTLKCFELPRLLQHTHTHTQSHT